LSDRAVRGRLIALLFVALLGVSVWKYHLEFGRRADAMALDGGAFGQFEIVACFPGVPEETAGKVREGDKMIIRGWLLAGVVEKSFQSKAAAKGELRLRFRSPNWLKCYLDPSPGTEVVFITDAYSLKGVIETQR